MKKTFLTKRNALVSSTDLSWGGYALSAAVALLLVRLIAPNFFWHMVTPVFRVADTLARESHTFFSSFGDTATLTLQNEKLRSENAALALENQTLLQKATSVGERLDTSLILAGVIARPPESPYDTLVLARGTRAGVTLGMEAFGSPTGEAGKGGVPVGVVTTVLADFSRVTLFSSPGMHMTGRAEHANLPAQAGVSLTITGSGAGTLSASVARSAGISVGDTVWAPGAGELPIGKVVRIESDPSSPSVIVRIMPVLNPFAIEWVVVRDVGAALRRALSQATSTLP